MKTNLLKTISYLVMFVASACVFVGCAGENSKFLQNGTTSDYFYLWSSTQKKDTLIFECAQTLKVNHGDEDLEYFPKATVKLYLEKDTVYLKSLDNAKPVLEDQNESFQEKGSFPITYTLTKRFEFSDTEVLCAKATYEAYTYNDGTQSYKLPYMSVSSIDFIKSSLENLSNTTTSQKANLELSIAWKEENGKKKGTHEAKLSYIQTTNEKPQKPKDTLISTNYNQKINWIEADKFNLVVEKQETWSQSGNKTTSYTSKDLTFYLSSKEDKTIEVENFDFSATEESSTTSTTDLSANDWQIVKEEITKTFKYSNTKNSFEDTFVYPIYKATLSLDGKSFPFDLEFVFKFGASVSKSSSTSATHKTEASLSFDNQTVKSEVLTTLNQKQTPPPPAQEEDIPTHGKVLTHFITAVYDASKDVTKRCVVIRYEEGYHWGICDYNEYFPKTFTYTQSGYSGFNSAAIEKKDGKYRLARATENSSAIYWYREDNTLISGIDFVSCKALGWKNKQNGKYSYKMASYQEEISSNHYTITITAPDGSSKTFKSKKRE